MEDYATDIGVALRHLGRPAVLIGWGIGALAALLLAQRERVLGLVLLAPSPPAGALPREPSDHELKGVPDEYDARWWGWIAPMDQLRSWMPDMTEDELSKMQEMLAGAHESGSARRERMRGVQIDPGRITVPTLVIGAGLDDVIHPSEARRTADLLGAAYEYFPSASHFGLVMGSQTWPQVAGSVLGWLEERRHEMAAAGGLVAARR
jgi:pimeloyl-ACP methyl ester carboxylesterase